METYFPGQAVAGSFKTEGLCNWHENPQRWSTSDLVQTFFLLSNLWLSSLQWALSPLMWGEVGKAGAGPAGCRDWLSSHSSLCVVGVTALNCWYRHVQAPSGRIRKNKPVCYHNLSCLQPFFSPPFPCWEMAQIDLVGFRSVWLLLSPEEFSSKGHSSVESCHFLLAPLEIPRWECKKTLRLWANGLTGKA